MNCFHDIQTAHCGEAHTELYAPQAGVYTLRITQNGTVSTQEVTLDIMDEFVFDGEWFNEATVAVVDILDADGQPVYAFDKDFILMETPAKVRIEVVPIY